jgi:ATP-binding cassette subfamily B multidrug efflux pump
MIMSFRISVTLTLVFVYCIPFLAVGLAFIMMKTHPIFEKVFRRYDDLNRVVEEDLRGIRVVKSYVREDYEIDEFHKISKVIYDLFSRAEKNLAFNMPIMQTAIYASMIAISWIGANLIVASGNSEARGMTTGQLMSVMSYVMQILMSFMMLSMIFVMITMSRASGERISEILNEKSDITDPESPLTEVKNGDIEFKNVSFSYSGNEERLCLKNINLKINTGETVGILGGTGSSKSSFVQLIPRLYDVTDGEVLVGDENVKKYDIKKLRDAVAMVLQKNELFAGTIKENLRWGNPDATDEQIVEVCKMAQADSFIEDFPQKYDTYIEQGGTNVSGGQKQRLCIARALLKNPRILILDDSTSAVDTKTDADIRKAFKNYIPSVTKLIIAQRVASVMEADKIIIMNNGMIDGFGTHEELMKNNEIYREVYTSQMKGSEPDAE